jgi:hypothetical protein
MYLIDDLLWLKPESIIDVDKRVKVFLESL